jgi:DNA mismatch repair ATPase MutS
VLVSAHDLELIDLLKDSYNLYHFSEKIDKDELSFDYKLKPGRLKNTNTIRILDINGFPKEIMHEARVLAKEIQLEKEVNLSNDL